MAVCLCIYRHGTQMARFGTYFGSGVTVRYDFGTTGTNLLCTNLNLLCSVSFHLFLFTCECTQIKADLYPLWLLIRQYVFKVDSAGIRKQLKWSRAGAHTHTHTHTQTVFIVYIEHLTFKIITKCYKHDYVSLHTQNTSVLALLKLVGYFIKIKYKYQCTRLCVTVGTRLN